MRYAIFSDIHSNLEALMSVLSKLDQERVDRYLCVGDIVGYGANPRECIDLVKILPIDVVAGNHDWASVGLFSLEYFNEEAQDAISWTKTNLRKQDKEFLESLKLTFKNDSLTLVHGTLNNPQDFNYLTSPYIAEETFKLSQTPICFVGHTHQPIIYSLDKEEHILLYKQTKVILDKSQKYIVNVGSVGQPRDLDPKASYCIFDTQRNEIEIKRTSYDVNLARKKIIEEGLPEFLGDRLLSGR